MKISQMQERLEEFDLVDLIGLRVAVQRELGRRWGRWLADPDAVREDAAEWPDQMVGIVAGAAQEEAEELEPWEERRDAYRRVSDQLMVEALSREQQREREETT